MGASSFDILPNRRPNENIDLAFASSLLNLPKVIGKHPSIGEDVFVKIGRYGPYLECNKKFYALKNIDKININFGEAIELIDNYKPKVAKKKKKS